MIGSHIGHALDPILLKLYRVLSFGVKVSPNVLSVCGVLVSIVAACGAAYGRFLLAGLLLLLSGFFDLLDGAVARRMNMVTRFGGFLDSVLDRYSDLLVVFGVAVYFLRANDHLFCTITFFAAIGVAIIPYARARAEAASIECRNGILERPERFFLLIVGFFVGVPGVKTVVVILAVLTHVTVFQRVWLVRKQSAGNSTKN